MAKQYRYGRVSTTAHGSYLTGPTTSSEKYRGARQAPLKSVKRAAILAKPYEDIVVSVYGRIYPGDDYFRWIASVFDREQFISDIQVQIDAGRTPEEAVQSMFIMNQLPDLILAWDIRPIKPKE